MYKKGPMNSYLDIYKLYVSGTHTHTQVEDGYSRNIWLYYLLPMVFLGENMIDHKAFFKLYNYTL